MPIPGTINFLITYIRVSLVLSLSLSLYVCVCLTLSSEVWSVDVGRAWGVVGGGVKDTLAETTAFEIHDI